MSLYQLHPQDLLFFRDARPMAAGQGSGGHGARWPEPSLIFDALHAALHRAFPNREPWEITHWIADTQVGSQRFGSLRTSGVFPCIPDEGGRMQWLFPCPQDVVDSGLRQRSDGKQTPGRPSLLQPCRAAGESDLPSPLTHHLASRVEPSKERPLPWWSKKAIEATLTDSGPALEPRWTFPQDELFAGEWSTGIGTDSQRDSQDGVRIYSAEYLRLKKDVALGFTADLPARDEVNGVDQLFDQSARRIIVGGQQRVCSIQPVPDQPLSDYLPVSAAVSGTRVKWVLLSPAVFPRIPASQDKKGRHIPEHPGGWLPTWVDTQGRVQLLDGPGEGKARRLRVAPGKRIEASLVAACVPKPITLTGWTEQVDAALPVRAENNFGPRATQLAVAAGAVYYFEAASPTDAAALAEALSWHGKAGGTHIVNRRSTLMGEKGFGLGVCGTWRAENELH